MSETSHTILIRGKYAEESAAILRRRISELGTGVFFQLQIDTEASLLERNSDFVYSMGTHDTPALAVEKILDQLAERGWLVIDTGELSPEEEAQIRTRLQGLGYLD